MVSLCYYLQQLYKNDGSCEIKWGCYGPEFTQHLGPWADKCKNIIVCADELIKYLQICDVVIYQKISEKKTELFTSGHILSYIKTSCKTIVFPSIHLDQSNYSESIVKLQEKEKMNNVDIIVSDIFISKKQEIDKLMLTINHPTTLLFLKLFKRLCDILDVSFFTNEEAAIFMENDNYMELPPPY